VPSSVRTGTIDMSARITELTNPIFIACQTS
jgi:hypothetical protein